MPGTVVHKLVDMQFEAVFLDQLKRLANPMS